MKLDYGVTCASCVDISDTANGRVLSHLPGVAKNIETKRWSLASERLSGEGWGSVLWAVAAYGVTIQAWPGCWVAD